MSTLNTEAQAHLDGWYPGLAYAPGPTCRKFIRSNARRHLLRTANQVGKTMAGAKKMDNWCLANADKVFAVLVADLENLYKEVCEKIHAVITATELIPATKYTKGKGYYTYGAKGIQYKNGTRVLFRTGKGPLQGLESFSADAGWIDEVPSPDHYGAFIRGVHGPCWVTFTPIGRDPKWFRAKVEGDPETGEEPEEKWEQDVAVMSKEECPWKEQWEVDEDIRKIDIFQRPQRVRGEWEGPTEARRLTAFGAYSVVGESLSPEHENAWYLEWRERTSWWSTTSFDHGENAGKEFALLFRWDAERVVVIDEYINTNATNPTEDAKHTVAMLKRRGVPMARVKRWLGDANSAGKGSVGESVNQMLGKALSGCLGLHPGAIHVRVPNKGKGSVEYGLQVINIAFEARELFIHERCRRLIRCVRHYQATKGPREPEKDGIDTLRYGGVDILCNSQRPSTKLYAGGMPTMKRGGFGQRR